MPAKPTSASTGSSGSTSCDSADSTGKVVKWTREAEAKAVQEIEKDDARRREKQQQTEEAEKREVEAERIRVRAEIERKVRGAHWHKSNEEFQGKVNQKKQEVEQLHLVQAPASTVKILAVNHPVPRIRDANELTAKFGYNVVYNKMFEGPYWRMLQAKKRDAPDQLFALLIMDVSKAPAEKKEHIVNGGSNGFFKILRFLQREPHPTLLNVLDVFMVDSEMFTITEMVDTYMERLFVKELKEPPSELRIASWSWQLADGMAYLHSHGIAHRNITPKTAWLTSNLEVKLGSFSLSTLFWDVKHNKKVLLKRSHKEQLEGHPPEEDGSFDPAAADVWMWGATVYFMVTKSFPTKQGGVDTTHAAIASLSEDGRRILEMTLQADPRHRPQAPAVLLNPWFKHFLKL